MQKPTARPQAANAIASSLSGLALAPLKSSINLRLPARAEGDAVTDADAKRE